jgi:beta-phosphoglucomutase
VPIRAVIFDFNGTLSDDEPVLCRIYCALFAEYGEPISEREYYERLSGLAEHTIAELCLGPGDPRVPAFIRERIDRYRSTVADGSTVTEAMRKAVRFAAAHAQLAIVSGAAREEIVPVVAAAGLGELFAVIVADDDVVLGKPDPESYLLALKGLTTTGAETLVFEDTEAGVASAKAAGAHVVALLGTQAPERLELADEVVATIDVPLLRRLLG